MKKVLIDCRAWKDRDSAHESLKRELGFPDWYGRNADALYDLLTERDYAIVLCNAAGAKERMGKDFDIILRAISGADALETVYDAMPGKPKGDEDRKRAYEKCAALETTADPGEREKLVRGLFGRLGARPKIENGLRCACGSFIRAGDDLEIDYGVAILDEAPVILGDRVKIGTGTVFTSRDPAVHGGEYGIITVGNDVRIGSRCLILPGAVIPDGTVIAPGSVVGGD